jgi:hypothetical protein
MMKRDVLEELGNYIVLFQDYSIVEFKMTTDAIRCVKDMHDSILGGRRIFIRMVSTLSFSNTNLGS